MTDETPAPTPAAPSSGWKPTTSTMVGGGLGLSVGQFIVAICDRVFHTPIGPELSGAITGLCVTLGNYFIRDGGRK